ncbi:hypothetical protein Bbelb_204660 [Branchiostoma belcheri]|nr:hypothetical protein Bbelb_204660 [Branchiostoma belcheri]
MSSAALASLRASRGIGLIRRVRTGDGLITACTDEHPVSRLHSDPSPAAIAAEGTAKHAPGGPMNDQTVPNVVSVLPTEPRFLATVRSKSAKDVFLFLSTRVCMLSTGYNYRLTQLHKSTGLATSPPRHSGQARNCVVNAS